MARRDRTLDARGFRDVADLAKTTPGTPNDVMADVGTVVTGVDGTASNAASKADVDTRLAAIDANFVDLTGKMNEVLDRLRSPSS